MDRKQQDFLKAYDELGDALFKHAFFRVSDREVALDLVSDAFMKTWNHMIKGGVVNNMKAFLYTTINHLVIDYYRKTKNGSLDALLDDGFDVSNGETAPDEHAEAALVMRRLDTLSESNRTLLVRRYVDGQSIGEIAELLSESENVISVRIHRAIQRLKTKYNHG